MYNTIKLWVMAASSKCGVSVLVDMALLMGAFCWQFGSFSQCSFSHLLLLKCGIKDILAFFTDDFFKLRSSELLTVVVMNLER